MSNRSDEFKKDTWDHRVVTFEMLRIWMSGPMLELKEKAWLHLRNGEPCSIDRLSQDSPHILSAANAVANFLRKLVVLSSSVGAERNPQFDGSGVIGPFFDADLARSLFGEDAKYWCGLLSQIECHDSTHHNNNWCKWFRDKVKEPLEKMWP